MSLINKDALMAIIQPLTGLIPESVTWDKDPQNMVNDVDAASVTLSIKNSTFLGGSDDKRRTYTAGVQPDQSDATYVFELTGQRSFTLQLKCEVYDKSAEAYEILEKVRMLLNANSELSAIGMAVQNHQIITDLPTSYDNRVVNVAVLELQLGLVVDIVASTQTGAGWIDTVDDKGATPGSSNVPGTLS